MLLFYLVDITIGLRVNEMEEKEGADLVYHILPDNLIEEISIEPHSPIETAREKNQKHVRKQRLLMMIHNFSYTQIR